MNSRTWFLTLALSLTATAPGNAQIEHMRQMIFGMD
jgi:hypothetical protein